MAEEQAFIEWRKSVPGQCAKAWEAQRLDAIVADIFGYNALQIGLPDEDLLAQSRIGAKFCCASVPDAPLCVRAEPWELPFATASVDLLLLAHTLDCVHTPHAVLREAERILRPEGTLLITGLNPFSLWRARAVRRRISPLRLREWLSVLGLETVESCFGCFRPPFRKERWLEMTRWLEAPGARLWPLGGGVYILRAVKRTRGVRLIEPQWRLGRLPGGKAATAGAARLTRREKDREPAA